MEFTIVLIRHSKSCANHVRHVAGKNEGLAAASQTLRDPTLSTVGDRMAAAYGPTLRARLEAAGVRVAAPTTLIASSTLTRAKQTAQRLFGVERPYVFGRFGEFGALPENTPEGRPYTEPDWRATLGQLAARAVFPGAPIDTAIIVGHGGFIRGIVGARRPINNLDAFVMRGLLTPVGDFLDLRITRLPYKGRVAFDAADQCSLPREIADHSKMKRYHRRTQKKGGRSQSGGGSMPLAFFKDGAQMQNTWSDPTGVGLAGTSASWAREPLAQTGGRRQQAGGFAPSVMGSFAVNGLRLAPLAAYMGYKQWSSASKRATRRRGTTRRRR